MTAIFGLVFETTIGKVFMLGVTTIVGSFFNRLTKALTLGVLDNITAKLLC